jgi:hypothetical protein
MLSDLVERAFASRKAADTLQGKQKRPANAAALRVVTALWLGVAVLQFMVWAAVCAVRGSVDSPWWVWEFIGGAIVVGCLRWASRRGTPDVSVR